MISTPVLVNKQRYRSFLIEKVVPSIKANWPGRNRDITIQQDSAGAHIGENDPAFVAVATAGVWRIKLQTQSPKSPDLNVLDLSIFGRYSRISVGADLQTTLMSWWNKYRRLTLTLSRKNLTFHS